MADLLNISSSHYVKLENDYVKPSYQLMERIKDKFPKADMNDFFK